MRCLDCSALTNASRCPLHTRQQRAKRGNERAFLLAHQADLTHEEIARAIGRTEPAVRLEFRGMGIRKQYVRHPRGKSTCAVTGCGLPARARGCCNRHYLRLYRKGWAA